MAFKKSVPWIYLVLWLVSEMFSALISSSSLYHPFFLIGIAPLITSSIPFHPSLYWTLALTK